MEHKQTENAIITNVDEDKGIVEAVWAVMGNIDIGNDIIHPGSFKKTFSERGNQIKLLDNHRTTSVMDALGTILELKELRGAELPQEVMNQFSDATGGAWGKFQFLMDTPEGEGAFKRIKAGAVKGWSFGYDTVDSDRSTVTKDDEQISVRNLRQLKLYEISPVLFPMNEAVSTTDVKSEDKAKSILEEESDDKAINLSQRLEDIRTAFQSLYNSPHGPWHYWVHSVYDEFLIVSFEGDSGKQFFQVSYSESDDEIKFAPQAEWIEGDFVFTPNGKSNNKSTVVNITINSSVDSDKLLKALTKYTTEPLKSEKTPTSENEAGPDKDKDTLQLINIELEEMEV